MAGIASGAMADLLLLGALVAVVGLLFWLTAGSDDDDNGGGLMQPLALRWVPFIGQFQPLTSLTPGGRNRVQSQCRPHGEFSLPESCVALHGSTSIGIGPG